MSEARAKVSHRVNAGAFWTIGHLTSPLFLLEVATVLLCVFGLTMVFSASSIELVMAGGDSYHTFKMQAIYMALGTVAFCVLRHVGANRFMQFKWLVGLSALAIVLLILVLVAGKNTNGATRWLPIGNFTLQPSEFAKITIVMACAHYVGRCAQGDMRPSVCAIRLLLPVVVPFGLIFAEKDHGTIIIIGVALFAMLYLAGVKPRYLVGAAIVALLFVVAAISIASYRSARFSIWLDPESDYYGNGWQSIHGFRALASGGFFGMGLGESRQKYAYLPEAENDYIFAIIGEELGFLGCMVLIGLFVFFAYCGLRIAFDARKRGDLSASLLAASLTVLIEFQAFLNMAGVTGILPLTGRPLPFITAGGSSVLACLIMAGLIAGVAQDNARDVREGRERRRARAKQRMSVVEGGRPYQEDMAPARPALRVPGEVVRTRPDISRNQEDYDAREQAGQSQGPEAAERSRRQEGSRR